MKPLLILLAIIALSCEKATETQQKRFQVEVFTANDNGTEFRNLGEISNAPCIEYLDGISYISQLKKFVLTDVQVLDQYSIYPIDDYLPGECVGIDYELGVLYLATIIVE